MKNIRNLTAKQYRNKIERLGGRFADVQTPPEGWLRTLRTALGMSGAQLARRLGVTRALVSNTEKAELSGGVTLKKMHDMAEAMNCRFVYAMVPETSLDDVLKTQALKKARNLVNRASTHMALEDQALSEEQLRLEVERLANEMLVSSSATLWNEEKTNGLP